MPRAVVRSSFAAWRASRSTPPRSVPTAFARSASSTERGIAFEEIDVADDDELRADLIQRTGRRTVPQIFIDGESIGGYEELAALDARRRARGARRTRPGCDGLSRARPRWRRAGHRAGDRPRVGRQTLTRGKEVYETRCAPCHGDRGAGDGPAAAAIEPKPRNFLAPEFWQGRTTAQLRLVVRKGRPGTLMAALRGRRSRTPRSTMSSPTSRPSVPRRR